MELDSMDRISELPGFVIHTILSLLPRKDAVRTSVLSKHWNRVWDTFPDLHFDQLIYTGIPLWTPELSPECVRRIGGFLDIAKWSLLTSTRCGVEGIKFSLKSSVFDDPGLNSDINECFELALRSSATLIDVLNEATPEVTVPEITFVSDSSCQYSSLRALTLSGVRISEKSLNDVFLSCPKVHTVRLLEVLGLAKLDICELDLLDSLYIMSENVLSVDIVDAPRLRRLHFVAHIPEMASTLNLTSCRGLRVLCLAGIGITDELIRSLATVCPLLEDLSVSNCDMLRKVTVSGNRLERLVLSECNGVKAVEVDAPALVWFIHQGYAFPRLFFKSNPPKLVHRFAGKIPINTSRFVDLRKFLHTHNLTDCLTVVVNPQEVVFDREELSQVAIPPAFQLRHLKLVLDYWYLLFDEYNLIDGLLWSCRPKTISMFSGTNATPHTTGEISQILLGVVENPTCCGSSGVKCWRHGLKSVRAERFGGESGPNDPVIRLELEWDEDSIQ